MSTTAKFEEDNPIKDEGNIITNNSPKTTGFDKDEDRAETPISINNLSPIHGFDVETITNINNNYSTLSRDGNEQENLQQIRKSIDVIKADLKGLSTNALSETVVRNLQILLLQQDNNQTYISKNEKYNYLRNLEHLLKNMKRLDDNRVDEISSIRANYEEKLSLLEQELQRKDSLIEVLTRVSDEKDKVIESLHLDNGSRVVTPRELREIKQEISNLKRHLPETTGTLSTIKKDRKKAHSTESLHGKKGGYNLKEKKDVKESLHAREQNDGQDGKELKDVKDFKELREYILNPGRSKSVQPLAGRKDLTISSFPIVHSLERLPNITKRTTK